MVASKNDHIWLEIQQARDIGVHLLNQLNYSVEITIFTHAIDRLEMQASPTEFRLQGHL
jgi:hypothetical protein